MSTSTVNPNSKRVALYWDCQTLKISPERANFLVEFSRNQGELVLCHAYFNWTEKSPNYAESLKTLGFQQIDIPSGGRNRIDHKLIVDCVNYAVEPDAAEIFIIVSGDGNFPSLGHILKSRQKKVIMFVQRGGFSPDLLDMADESHIIESLEDVPRLPAFRDLSLLNLALIHRSYANEHPEVGQNNETLEFLGDSVLNFLSTHFIYRLYPDLNESQLTRLRSALVDETQLADFANYLELGKKMKLGKGAIKDKARKNDSLLSDTFEAIIGAYFLDSGIESVRNFVEPLFESAAEGLLDRKLKAESSILLDAKNRFQEWVQGNLGPTQPKYETIAQSGPDHAPDFTVEVKVGNQVYGVGKGRSKKEAEKRAAELALKQVGAL
ncbi:ribonuclease III [Laspinema sp. D2d]|uniref:ribonuclease III n=1 Tax=Laspinema sp. D2d TaxID=2953686 RepID=UPI00294FFB95|nr:ribonuclease III [Laspinema sp. D2d]